MLSVHTLFYNLTNQIIFIGACYLNLYKISCHQLSAGLNEYQTIYIRSIHIGSCCISILIRKPAFNHCQHSTPHCILCFFKSNLLLQFHNLCLSVFLDLFLYLIFKFSCGSIFFRRICKDT